MYLALSNVTRMVGSVSEVRPVRTEADQFMTLGCPRRRQYVDVKVLRECVALRAARQALENVACILIESLRAERMARLVWHATFVDKFSPASVSVALA
jgi:hypothetical protein